MLARYNGVIVPLPELTTSARLLIGSTATAPSKLRFTALPPVGVKLTVVAAVCPVGTMVTRWLADGSSSEIWFSDEFKETTVFVKGWKATAEVPTSAVHGSVLPDRFNPLHRFSDEMLSSSESTNVICELDALGSAKTALRVMGLISIPCTVGVMENVKKFVAVLKNPCMPGVLVAVSFGPVCA